MYFLNRSTLYDLLCVWQLTKLRMIVCLSLIADLDWCFYAWLLKEGPVYLCKFITSKSDPLRERVYLLDANPLYAHIRLSNGNKTTVSTSNLAPVPENAYFENENNLLMSSPDATPPALLTNGETSNMSSVVVDQTDGTQLTAEADLNNLPSPSANKTIDLDAV